MNQSGYDDAVEDFRERPRPLILSCGVQHYAWGDPDYIPALLGVPNRDHEPYAELWIGAHPGLPSTASLGGTGVPLPLLLHDAADALLGPGDAERFDGALPFLLKILSAAQPLSIQAHPNKHQAQAGFERENRLGIPPDAPQRNYHDENHKPELISALTDFYALRGFRPLNEIGQSLASVPELHGLAADYRGTRESLAQLYGQVMRMEQGQVDAILDPLLQRLRQEDVRHAFSKEEIEYWLLRADVVFSRAGHRDRGLFSLFLLNLVHLLPGEAMYLPAGELHAYLQGAGVEIMANSNNVLRGGLTPKHTDVDELLRILTFDAGEPAVIRPGLGPDEAGTVVYEAPSEELALSRLRIAAERPDEGDGRKGLELGVVTEGDALIESLVANSLPLERGSVFLVPHGLSYRISCDAQAVVFTARIPG